MAKRIKSEIIDTNVLIRFFVGDNKDQQKEARDLFSQAQQGKRKLLIKPLIVAEACFVLESFYKKEKVEIADAFGIFLTQTWILVEDRNILLSIWDWYKKGFHFVDSYLLSWAKSNDSSVVTFDKELKKALL